MCKVSVIVPVYNTEKYLRACLESLAAQTMDDIEIIVVNDGSTDGSLAIAEEFAQDYSYFSVYSTDNKGQAHARNYGAERSQGEYLAFVDSDDDVEPDYCKAMYEKAVRDGNDVVMCRVDHIVQRNGQIQSITYPKTFWEEDNFKLADHPYLFARMSTGPWDKLVSRDLFFRVRFSDDILYVEDFLYTVELFCLAENIGIEKQILYHYYHTHSMHIGFRSRFGPERLTLIPCMEQIQQFIDSKGLDSLFHKELEVLYIRVFKNYHFVLIPPEGSDWNIRLHFVRQTQAFLKEYCPNWRQNPYYREAMHKRAKQFRPFYYNYGEKHMLFLLYLSHFLPKVLYKQVLRADHVLVYLCRYIRWGLLGSV